MPKGLRSRARNRRKIVKGIFLTSTLLLVACGGGGGGGGGTGAPVVQAPLSIVPAGIEITGLAPVQVEVSEGGSTSFTISQNCPAAIATGALSSAASSGGETTSTLTVTPAGAGTCSIVVRDGSGVTQTLSVGVTTTTVVTQ
jgi:hypothetical protein